MNFQTCHGNQFQPLHGTAPAFLMVTGFSQKNTAYEHQAFVKILTELKIYSQILYKVRSIKIDLTFALCLLINSSLLFSPFFKGTEKAFPEYSLRSGLQNTLSNAITSYKSPSRPVAFSI